MHYVHARMHRMHPVGCCSAGYSSAGLPPARQCSRNRSSDPEVGSLELFIEQDFREPADENERSTDVLLSAACLRSGFPDLSQNSDFTAAAGFSAG